MLSTRATGLYLYLLMARPQISAEGLSRVFSEGEKAIGSCLRELRNAGLLITRREHINGHIMTISHIVDPDSWTAETAVLIQHTPLNSILSTNSIFSKKQTRYPGGPGEGYEKVNLPIGDKVSDFPASYDPDDMEKDRARARAKQHESKQAANEQKFNKVQQKRSGDPTAWGITDSVFEFATQMHSIWHIQPWSLTTSRFRIAFANARIEHGTNGAIEKFMMTLYFDQIKHDTKINDPEHVWKRFIQQYSSLKIEAERLMVTPADVKAEEEAAEKSAEWMFRVQPK